MLEPLRMESAGPPDQPVDRVAFREQQLGQVGAILPGDPRDERYLHAGSPYRKSTLSISNCAGIPK
jgi:hypothetical protein